LNIIIIMSQKTIKINPEYLTLNKRKKETSNKKTKKEKPTAPVTPNKLRKQLLARIKNHQQQGENNSEKKLNVDKDKTDLNFHNDFNKSMNYLEELSKKKKQIKKNKKQTRKQKETKPQIFVNTILPDEMNSQNIKLSNSNNSISNSNSVNNLQNKPLAALHNEQPVVLQNEQPVVLQKEQPIVLQNEQPIVLQNEQPIVLQNEQPLYSCLKNGTRPTYRQLYTRKVRNNNDPDYNNNHTNKKQFVNEGPPINIELPISLDTCSDSNSYTDKDIVNSIDFPISNNSQNIENLESFNKIDDKNCNNGIIERKLKLQELKKKYKKEPKIFKQKKIKTIRFNLGKKEKNVSVLIKNNDTRKKVKKAHAELKKKNIIDIKKYLKDHNLLKIGTEAPNDVLRELYEQTRLAGEINNNNSENLLHNYLTK